MYKMEPLNRFSSKDLAPSYYGSTCASAALVEGSSADVAALEIRQETVLQRLRDLKLQLDKLQSSKFSSLSPSKTSSTAIGAAAQSSPLKPSVGEKQAIVLKVMASVTDHSRELSSLQIHDLEQEKELESEVDVRDQQRSILCKLSALKISKVSELHPGLVTSSKDERIAERQRSILKVIRALKEEVHRDCWELQEREKAKECSTELDVITHHKEVLKKLASLQEELVKLLRGLHDLSWETGTVHDLVISANPSRPPYFLILLRRLLKDAGYPVFSVDHLHSSVQHVDESLRRCFSDKPLGDRNKHNLAFTVHWKDVESPNLMVNPLRQTVISGEANIARYVSRLFPLSSSYNYEATGTFSSIAETDNLLDQLAAQAASKNNKERQGALRQLNGRLGKSSWLVSNECGIADVLLWSVLKQGGLNVGAPANVDKWYKKVDAMANLVNLLNSQNATQSKSSSQATTPIQKKSDSKDSLSSCKAQFVDRNGLEKYLKSLSIPYQVQDHEEVFTVDALMKNVRGMPGLHMKNLFLKDKKKNLYLVSARHNAEVKLNEIGKQLGIKDLRFGDESILYNTLGVKQGCVTAFALLNDRSHQVKFLLDSEAFNDCHPFVNFHPMSNAATLGVAPKDLKKFLNATGHEPTLITLN
ncbi:uncharacterized protein LOC122247696 isoform X2 [Penaeus japonicus]|uniref:uncharacterized protein LOC122247696 isoform X2 n=1 Tax=Penaeus japonicus TaxID=27405 RepID=UPI001C7172F6|nr:uncharacterized protein LOC122247696 isoform X2 [Penaeus japonicus]